MWKQVLIHIRFPGELRSKTTVRGNDNDVKWQSRRLTVGLNADA